MAPSKPLTKTNRITKKGIAATKAAAKEQQEQRSASANTKTGAPARRDVNAVGPALDVNGRAYDAAWKESKKAMGKPIHAEERDRIEHILRVFDGNASYGPSLGLTRLERWERANDLDLDPPPVIKDILTTKQGQEMNKYWQDSLTQLDTAL